jgi:hypothetical protein
MVGLSEIENLFFDLLGDSKSGVLRARFTVDQSLVPPLGIGLFPLIIGLAGNPKITAGF